MLIDEPIRAILARYRVSPHTAAIESLGMAGGLSGALFWRIRLPNRKLILRRWPAEHPTAERLAFIHAVLRHVSDRGIKLIPVPLLTNDKQSFVETDGRFWELAPWMPGTASFATAPNTEKLSAAMRTLAQFHLAVADFDSTLHTTISPKPKAPGPEPISPPIMRRAMQLTRALADGSAVFHRATGDSDWPELVPLAREFVAALPSAAPKVMALLEPVSQANLPLQVCLRDIWHDHIIFTGDELTGLVDFGALDIDTPAGDIARLLGSLVGDDHESWKSGIEAYESVRLLSPDEHAALPGLDAASTIIALSNWLRWLYLEHRQFENREQVMARFAALLERIRNH